MTLSPRKQAPHTRAGRTLGLVAVGLWLLTTGCNGARGWPLDTVAAVNVARYAGTWYEIASYPHLFQRGCSDTRAEYTPSDNGRVSVKNTCRMAGREVTITGYADVPDPEYPGRLGVHLNVPVVGQSNGQYYIIALDPDYQWAVVGHPNRQYLWILSRNPTLSAKTIRKLLPDLETTSEYKDVRKKLRCTRQSEGDAAGCTAALDS